MKSIYMMLLMTFFCCNTLRKEKEVEAESHIEFYQKVERASFENINRIKKLNGKFIEIEGIFRANFEDVALYPFSSSKSTSNALWLNLKMPDSLFDKLAQKKVKVIGRVDTLDKGHLGGYFASLDSVFYIKDMLN